MKCVEKYGMPVVHNLIGRTGNPVVNQFVIMMPDGLMFQSYDSRICYYDIDENMIYVGADWDRSATTRNYLIQFMRLYCHRWYAKVMSRGKRSFRANLQQCIVDGVVKYVEHW